MAYAAIAQGIEGDICPSGKQSTFAINMMLKNTKPNPYICGFVCKTSATKIRTARHICSQIKHSPHNPVRWQAIVDEQAP